MANFKLYQYASLIVDRKYIWILWTMWWVISPTRTWNPLRNGMWTYLCIC